MFLVKFVHAIFVWSNGLHTYSSMHVLVHEHINSFLLRICKCSMWHVSVRKANVGIFVFFRWNLQDFLADVSVGLR